MLGLAAINTANNLMYIIVSGLLGLMGISGFFGKRNIQSLEVDITFPDEIYANRHTFIKVTLKNPRRFLPAFLIRLNINGNDILFHFIDCQGSETKFVPLLFTKRGAHRIDNLHVSSVYPFNFFIRFKKITTVFNCIIFPEPKPCIFDSSDEVSRQQDSKGKGDFASSIGDIASLRKYEYGDPLKLIHWKATARTGTLITKEFSQHTAAPVIIDLDKMAMNGIEEKISCATEVILRCFKLNIAVGLRSQYNFFEPSIDRHAKLKMLTHLALM